MGCLVIMLIHLSHFLLPKHPAYLITANKKFLDLDTNRVVPLSMYLMQYKYFHEWNSVLSSSFHGILTAPKYLIPSDLHQKGL